MINKILFFNNVGASLILTTQKGLNPKAVGWYPVLLSQYTMCLRCLLSDVVGAITNLGHLVTREWIMAALMVPT